MSLIRLSLCLAAVGGACFVCSSCLPMLATQNAVAAGHAVNRLFSPSSLELVWRGDVRSFLSSGLEKPGGFKVSPADSYSLLMQIRPDASGEWACYHDRENYYWAAVDGLSEEKAGFYALRRGVAINGMTGETDQPPAPVVASPAPAAADPACI